MKMTENRFDPSALTSRQLRELDRLSEAVLADERPALVGREGVRLELPEPACATKANCASPTLKSKNVTASNDHRQPWCAIAMGDAPVRMFYQECLRRAQAGTDAKSK
jgi:hypothetical protein